MSNDNKYTPFESYKPDEESREDYQARRELWFEKESERLKGYSEKTRDILGGLKSLDRGDINNLADLDRENQKVAKGLFGWLWSQHGHKATESNCTNQEYNESKASQSLPKEPPNPQADKPKRTRLEWFLDDDGYMKQREEEY